MHVNVIRKPALVLFGLLAAGAAVAAAINGAIFTTVADGTAVNANIYDAKEAVYLNGGPQTKADPGLVPDGFFYFQVTDPSGAVLLSSDDITCRVVEVKGGRVIGVPATDAGGFGNPACYHRTGTFNAANGTLPVQLMPYKDTPNPGGEYKAWLTKVADYGVTCGPSHQSFGFCDSASKTDNFKVRTPKTASVTVCKFNDVNANGLQDAGEPMIPHWPITATGVDGGTVASQTGDDGCVAFSVVDFASGPAAVTLREGSVGPDWTQTAPMACDLEGCSVTNGVISLSVTAGMSVTAPAFGNHNPFCLDGCSTDTLVASATASSSYTRTYAWTLAKTVDQDAIRAAEATGTFKYDVTVTHDAGTSSDWATTGQVRLSNPGVKAMAGVMVSVTTTAGGNCTIGGTDTVDVAAGSHLDVPYACTFDASPTGASLVATIYWNDQTLTASADLDLAHATVVTKDDEVTVTDSATGALGTVTLTSPNPTVFTYDVAVSAAAGSCATFVNTATATTNTTATASTDAKTVQFCRGADLVASVSATPTFQSQIEKTASKTVVQQQGGSASVNYTVTAATSGWQVAGLVRVVNPNDWQAVNAVVTVEVPGATCAGTGTALTLSAASSDDVPFTCTFATAPAATGTVTATVTWDSAAAFTPTATATAVSDFAFGSLTITDTFDGVLQTLGTVPATAASTVYTYTRTLANALSGVCRDYVNVAAIAETAQSATRTVTMCNTLYFGRTIGFWQNKNGQALVTGAPASIATWLRAMAPFQDLSATATTKTVASYVTTVIKAANASGSSMNAMLKAQMLATALSVYFTDPALGGNKLGARIPLGTVKIDVTTAATAFGGATKLTVLELLSWQNGTSNAGGSLWYGNVKAVQELAKNVFDAINNEAAPIAR